MSTPTEILQHYLTMIMREAGLSVDSDTYAEIDEIVDGIIAEAQRPLLKRIEALEKGEGATWIGSRKIQFSDGGDKMIVTDPPHMEGDKLIAQTDLDINYFCAKYSVTLKQIVTRKFKDRNLRPMLIGIFEGKGDKDWSQWGE